MAEWSRAITWAPIWDKNREGVGLEHLLLREGWADSVVLALDEDGRPFRLAYRLAWTSRGGYATHGWS